ncbi:MAG: YidH family protein [Steroidobacteraceae bacterium]
MIDRYSDHAANERTFLAWIRTGIAVIAFGLLIEKFTPVPADSRRRRVERRRTPLAARDAVRSNRPI